MGQQRETQMSKAFNKPRDFFLTRKPYYVGGGITNTSDGQ